MSFTEQETMKTNTKKLEELEGVIAKAIKKVRGRKENDLCKYIPINTGGYIHHFTLRKMKYKNPGELTSMIEKFIMKADRPLVVPPKQRAARGSRKKKDQLAFSKLQLERLLNMAILSGDKEMISLLSPKKSLAHCKRELIQSVRHGIVDHELWNAYVESVNAQQALIAAGAEALSRN
ncbi:MAG: hypothetical protein KDK63_05630 [Chlamydiia bacterium]|nr:hypothetical protein [Chlamydiia bacterium]MCB1084442.1 hypothetical protein [Simkania sp.]MCB1115979.1 hypothetical protein [Chlamydiia bacterium]